MKTKFLIDNLKEKERQEIKKILESLKYKPYKVNHKAIFLRKFILALLHTLNKDYQKEYVKEIELPRELEIKIPEKINLTKIIIPEKLKLNIEIPKKLGI